MAHRSNQAVASQAQTPEAPEEPPRPRRALIGWATAIAALCVSTFLICLGLWLARLPLASFFIGAALSERGADADFQVVNLDLNGLTLSQVRFGAENSPDAAISTVQATWRWRGLVPALDRVRIVEPRVHLRIDPRGYVSAGALDRLRGGSPGRRRPSLPAFTLDVVDGHALIDAPFGALEAPFRASGKLGENFSALARISETSRRGNSAYSLQAGAADLIVVSRDNTIAFRLNASARELVWANTRIEDGTVRLLGRTPMDLGRIDLEGAWRIASLAMRNVDASQLTGTAGGEALMRDDALSLANWQAQARISAAEARYGEIHLSRARFEANAEGLAAEGRGRWTLGGDRFVGLAMISDQPAAAGRMFLDTNHQLSGDALITFARTRLNDDAQQDLREAFPNLAETPIGPTFAQAEHALDAAADSFTLSVPLVIAGDADGTSLTMSAPAEARATTGAILRLAPLRQDTPALVLQWPGAALHGAIDLELSGGGAPNASLLFDTLTWSPGAPFEADGTLALASWHTENASIDANELGITIAVPPAAGGRIDLRGPARITGPLADGAVRDLTPTLDVAITWGNGWRVTPNNGCLPVRMAGLDAAGLSFGTGNFALCSLNGALIAADAAETLSGGFSIQRLNLTGTMAGPEHQPARLSASNVIGRFGGRTGNMQLRVEAATPTLAIDMGEARTLSVALSRLTANAQFGNGWRIDGNFEAGTLSDPSLPGSVSTIAGAWSMAPENERAVIRVSAGEALLTANRPASDDERPLFHPLRLTNVDATMSDGRIDARGAIVLEERARQLAEFTAEHNVGEGVGVARVTAADITFSPALQPYDITEQARGLVDGVTGGISLNTEIVWTRDVITGQGRARLNDISLATATIPVVHGVRGEIFFDNLFALTTPPGQRIQIATLNPGVEVHNGRVRFQLLPDQRVAIEQADFDFASGTLSMQPTTIGLGEDESRFELTLRDVEAAELLRTLNVSDLTATGQLEGSFPLLLTRRSAFVNGGVVRAQGDGGVISYTGAAGESATGPARVAFDALRSFRYDALSLTLDGDLNGDVISSIEFSGHNAGRPVDLSPVAPIPGVGRVTVRGVPFDFNVRVTAPFRRLAQTAATITDPGSLINQTENDPSEEEVDQAAPPPR